VLRGEVAGAERLTVDGRPVELAGDGSFTVRRDTLPVKLAFAAEDAAGNVARREIAVEPAPRRPAQPVRSVHVTAEAWANDQLREGVLALVREHRVNAVELDLKDESGVVGWNAPVPLARKAGAVSDIYDLRAAVQQLHDLGVRVIGRLVVFRDPKLAAWAWRAKKRTMVIQTPSGRPYTGGYDAFASFTNLASPEVRAYNVAIAVAAAKLGVDDILYDYVRRPDGPLDTMVFPDLKGSPEDAIVGFLAQTRTALEPTRTFLGASVFGISATRPEEIAQDVPRIAREVDYVAPMLYPSHWAPGEYGVANPNAQPYDIVLRSLEDFERAVRGSGARVVPWLQDFSLGVEYGPAEVRAQIQATRDAGLDEWLLWDPAVTYTAAAIPDDARVPATGERPATTSFVTASALAPNELGEIPVLMYHQVVAEGGGEYDVTPQDFREELERLYREGYRPVTASQLAAGDIDVPKGTTPVVLTFDDGTASQAALRPDGTLDPRSAAGMILAFARTHPGFEPRATFYVNRDPFAAGAQTGALLRVLREHGFELGNHTRDHANLSQLPDAAVQEQFVSLERLVHAADPQARLATMALPFGVMPQNARLARRGSFGGDRYAFTGVMLVGAEPAPSPYGRAWNPAAIPRIRASLDPSLEYGFTYWLDRLKEKPARRYVSDGDPERITVPKALQSRVAAAYRDRVALR
jgi:peptidoglycan/xylan/chitin deacetylase (PgdA/CDA1 family)